VRQEGYDYRVQFLKDAQRTNNILILRVEESETEMYMDTLKIAESCI
jgi:hypothetical protein